MDDLGTRDTRRSAVAVGIVAAGSAVCLATYFVAGEPFGTMNDIGNAATGLLSASLAWRLRRHATDRLGEVATGAALVGAAITVIGSTLVVSGTTGFFLAGLVSSVGFACIGGWLLVVNRSVLDGIASPRLRAVGAVAGSLMALGLAAVPGIPLKLDDMATAPAWAYVGMASWLGTYVAYPAWAIALGMKDSSPRRLALPAGRS